MIPQETELKMTKFLSDSRGGITKVFYVLRRVGSKLHLGNVVHFPLYTICLHLEKTVSKRTTSRLKPVGDEKDEKALLVRCKGVVEPIHHSFDILEPSCHHQYIIYHFF